MYGRTVTIDGKSWLVMCTPNTPFSEVLERASRMAFEEERAEREASPTYQNYRKWVRYANGQQS